MESNLSFDSLILKRGAIGTILSYLGTFTE